MRFILLVPIFVVSAQVSAMPCQVYLDKHADIYTKIEESLTVISRSGKELSGPVARVLIENVAQLMPTEPNEREQFVRRAYGHGSSQRIGYTRSNSELFAFEFLQRLSITGDLFAQDATGEYQLLKNLLKMSYYMSESTPDIASRETKEQLARDIDVMIRSIPVKMNSPESLRAIEVLSRYAPLIEARRFERLAAIFGRNEASYIDMQGSNLKFTIGLLQTLGERKVLGLKDTSGTPLLVAMVEDAKIDSLKIGLTPELKDRLTRALEAVGNQFPLNSQSSDVQTIRNILVAYAPVSVEQRLAKLKEAFGTTVATRVSLYKTNQKFADDLMRLLSMRQVLDAKDADGVPLLMKLL